MASKRLNLVVATCNNRGIGVNGTLPWRLKGDMAFFKRVTTETTDPAKQNVVIMGRKTWDSIPQKFRPLQKRINIVISRTLVEAPAGALLAHSLDEAVEIAASESLADQVESLFIIGGNSIYEMALNSEYCYRIYLTHVLADFNCDTFLPKYEEDSFKKTLVEGIDPAVIHTDNGINYRFEVYQKDENAVSRKRKLAADELTIDEKKVRPVEELTAQPILHTVDYSAVNVSGDGIEHTVVAQEEEHAQIQTVSVDSALVDHIEAQVDKGVKPGLLALSRTMGRMESRLHNLEKTTATGGGDASVQ